MSTKTAIVTGASSGIGRATVNRLIAEGYNVVAVARREARLEEMKEKWGDRIHVMSVDVTVVSDVEAMVKQTIDQFGQIDVLVNNAGVGMIAALEDGKLDDWLTMIDVNVKGVLICLHACLPELIKSHGHIINLASVAAHDVFPNAVVYCASKHAVNAITVGFRKEFREKVKITNISPGPVDTEFADHTNDDKLKEEFKKSFKGVVIKAEDIAGAILHILNLPEYLVVNEYIIRPNK